MIKTLHYFKFILLVNILFFSNLAHSQVIDTLAIQDFELTPKTPTWNYTGTPNAFLSGSSSASATPANSPIGIDTSRAWHTVSVSGGNPVEFNNQIIPTGYDSIRVTFKLAAMNLNGSTGGPDHLDYVLLSYSTDSGNTFTDRIRVRGAVNNNCSWPYTAAKTATAFYLPATEIMYQPTNSGLQIADGYSTVELVFPGSVNQVSVRITPRSSSSSDSWLIDNLVLTGEKQCANIDTSIVLTNDSIYANATSATYQWIDCSNNTAISGATNQSFIAPSNGSYAVIVTQNSCSDTSACATVTGVSIDELLSDNNIKMYPNPVNNLLTIEFENTLNSISLNLTNINGQVVYSKSNITNSKEVINVNNLTSGIYFISLETDGTSKHLKFIKN